MPDPDFVMSPALRRAVRILCLSRRELDDELVAAAASNRFVRLTPRSPAIADDVVAISLKGTLCVFVIDSYYVDLDIQAASAATAAAGDEIIEADRLVRACNERRRRLYEVAETLIYAQRAFVEDAAASRAALSVDKVAEQLGISRGTVAMLCAGKHLLAPRGRIALVDMLSEPLDAAWLDRLYATYDYRPRSA